MFKFKFLFWGREFLKRKYINPLAQGLDINAKEAIAIHRRIIKENKLLAGHHIFIYQYFKKIEDSLSDLDFPSLEIGSGGGFLREFLPKVITSDIVESEGIDRIENATSLSFPDNSLKAVYANGVLHHIKDSGKCLEEIQRVLVLGGKFVCNEPSTNFLGYFMNKYFHNEYTNKFTKEWKILEMDSHGRLTDANMALPYIMFKRDIDLFRQRFRKLKIISIIYHNFLRYTLSGGLSYKPFIPRVLYGMVDFIERFSKPLMPILGSNMLITIQRINN